MMLCQSRPLRSGHIFILGRVFYCERLAGRMAALLSFVWPAAAVRNGAGDVRAMVRAVNRYGREKRWLS